MQCGDWYYCSGAIIFRIAQIRACIDSYLCIKSEDDMSVKRIIVNAINRKNV